MANQEIFKLERYKYILARKQSLNEATFKITAIYQVVIAALAISQYNVIVMLKSKSISYDIAQFSSICLFFMLAILTVLIVALLVGGVFAWLKYRRDEQEMEIDVFGISRARVGFFNIFSWYETYIVITVLAVFALGLWAYFERLVPLLLILSAG